MKQICTECSKAMTYWGLTVERHDTGEHMMCNVVRYWDCPDIWCGGSKSVAVGWGWTEKYDEKPRDNKDMIVQALKEEKS